MSKVRNVSNVHKDRIHNLYVDHTTQVTGVSPVDRVASVQGVDNDSHDRHETFLIASDQFYDKLKKLRDEYKRFYHDEQNLEKAIKDIQNSKDDLYHNMKKLVEVYNNAVQSLHAFDEVFYTQYAGKLVDIVKSFSEPLEKIGILIELNGNFSINEGIFKEQVEKHKEHFAFLFEPLHGMIVQLYRAFRSIKVPKEERYESNYVTAPNPDYPGLLLDKKQ